MPGIICCQPLLRCTLLPRAGGGFLVANDPCGHSGGSAGRGRWLAGPSRCAEAGALEVGGAPRLRPVDPAFITHGSPLEGRR